MQFKLSILLFIAAGSALPTMRPDSNSIVEADSNVKFNNGQFSKESTTIEMQRPKESGKNGPGPTPAV